MSTDTIKSIAAGLITIPSRPVHHEALLDSALTSALAMYSAVRPLLLCATLSGAPTAGADEQGDYAEFNDIPLSSGILYATTIIAAGEHYKHRIVGATANGASVRIYAALSGTISLTIWRPAAHAADAVTWPAHHEALIALMCASFYLNGVSLSDPDVRRSEMLQSLAASYLGRAQATLSQS